MLIISTYRVPFAPIIEGKNSVFPLFDSLRTKYEWVLETWRYRNRKNLIAELKKEVVDRCEEYKSNYEKKYDGIFWKAKF